VICSTSFKAFGSHSYNTTAIFLQQRTKANHCKAFHETYNIAIPSTNPGFRRLQFSWVSNPPLRLIVPRYRNCGAIFADMSLDERIVSGTAREERFGRRSYEEILGMHSILKWKGSNTLASWKNSNAFPGICWPHRHHPRTTRWFNLSSRSHQPSKSCMAELQWHYDELWFLNSLILDVPIWLQDRIHANLWMS